MESQEASSSTSSDNTTLDYSFDLPVRGRRNVRGGCVTKRGKGRGGSVRGKRKQRGKRLGVGDAERLRELAENKKRRANEIVDKLNEQEAKDLLKKVAEKMPSVLLDIAETLSQHAPEPEPSGSQDWPSWCICQRCREMPTDRENVCCGMRPNLCSSVQPEMELFILDEMALHLSMLYRDDVLALGAVDEENINKSYRHAAYRAYILHEYGRLTVSDRRVVPSCVTWRVRDRYPSQDGSYVGFKPTL